MIRVAWLALAILTVIAAIFLERRQVIPQPWGYVVYDRITGNYEACDLRRPGDYLADFARKGATTVPKSRFRSEGWY
jgi:hypothetical protein